jgi:hypothetical protein
MRALPANVVGDFFHSTQKTAMTFALRAFPLYGMGS